MPQKSHTHKRCGTLRKKSFSARGYANFGSFGPSFGQIWVDPAALTVANSMPQLRLKS
jgi:hypothetical protein